DHPCMPVAAAQGLVVLASGAVGAASATAAVLLATVLGDFVDLAGHVRATSSATAPEGGVQQRLDVVQVRRGPGRGRGRGRRRRCIGAGSVLVVETAEPRWCTRRTVLPWRALRCWRQGLRPRRFGARGFRAVRRQR